MICSSKNVRMLTTSGNIIERSGKVRMTYRVTIYRPHQVLEKINVAASWIWRKKRFGMLVRCWSSKQKNGDSVKIIEESQLNFRNTCWVWKRRFIWKHERYTHWRCSWRKDKIQSPRMTESEWYNGEPANWAWKEPLFSKSLTMPGKYIHIDHFHFPK